MLSQALALNRVSTDTAAAVIQIVGDMGPDGLAAVAPLKQFVPGAKGSLADLKPAADEALQKILQKKN
jgi:hypothetical protein